MIVCIIRFLQDGKLYRARVVTLNYTDFANTEEVGLLDMYKLPPLLESFIGQ